MRGGGVRCNEGLALVTSRWDGSCRGRARIAPLLILSADVPFVLRPDGGYVLTPMSRHEGRRHAMDPHAGARKGSRTHVLAIVAAFVLAATWWLADAPDAAAAPVPSFSMQVEHSSPAPLCEPVANGELVRIEAETPAMPAATALARDLVPPGKLADLPADRAATIAAGFDHHADETRDRAQAIDQTRRGGQLAWLKANHTAALHAAAAEVLRQGRAWPFLEENADSRRAARQNLPRDWESLTLVHAMRTPDGKSIDVLIPIDPEEFPEPGTLRRRMGSVRLVRTVNCFPDDKRRELIETHLAAMRSSLEADAPKRFPPDVEIDFTDWTLRLR